MAKTRGTGLLMLWTDVDAQHEAEFNRWYDEEHLDRLLKVPGFLSASRYVALRGGPKYLAMYELEEAACCAPPRSWTRCASAPPRGGSRPRAATSGATTC